jgi:hypothetical protein
MFSYRYLPAGTSLEPFEIELINIVTLLVYWFGRNAKAPFLGFELTWVLWDGLEPSEMAVELVAIGIWG